VAIALDRMERGKGELSAVQEVRRMYGIPVTSIVNLESIVDYLGQSQKLAHHLPAVEEYRSRYSASRAG
jgi:orotate phosphoribosyltransferase